MSVFPWFLLPVPWKVQWILILVNVTTACLICTASPHTFWQSQHILSIIGWRSHWTREGRNCECIHIVRPSRRGVASSVSGVFVCFVFFCPFTICIFSIFFIFVGFIIYAPYRTYFWFCCVLVFSEFGGLVFGNLVFCINDFFWYVVIFFCAPGTWYVFWYLVAFIIVILLHEVYHFRYFGSSLFRIVFRILVFCSYFFCILCFCTTCCIWCIVI